jgi:hypothetical protein
MGVIGILFILSLAFLPQTNSPSLEPVNNIGENTTQSSAQYNGNNLYFLTISKYIIWMVPLFLFLWIIHKRADYWSERKKAVGTVFFIGFAVIPFIILEVFDFPLVPDHLLTQYVFSWDETTQKWVVPTMDPRIFLQIYWTIPLWVCAWYYNWEIETLQKLIKKRKVSASQTIWFFWWIVLTLFLVGILSGDFLEFLVTVTSHVIPL